MIDIFEIWNNKNIIKHKKITEKLESSYKKAKKDFSKEEIIKAINNYKSVLESDFYYKHKFTLENFLKQGNGIYKFTDEGEIYINYLENKKTSNVINAKFNNSNKEIRFEQKYDFV